MNSLVLFFIAVILFFLCFFVFSTVVLLLTYILLNVYGYTEGCIKNWGTFKMFTCSVFIVANLALSATISISIFLFLINTWIGWVNQMGAS